MCRFRFENLEIWKFAIEISNKLFDIADMLIERKKFKFAEQINSVDLSISHNIVEGFGSFSDKDFANFLNISRWSLFDCANVIAILKMRGLISNEEKDAFHEDLDHLCSMITNFRKTLLRRKS